MKIYQVGTLKYSIRGLAILFAWLLWGDFAFTFFENIFGRFIPLYLKDLQASNTLIGVMTGSIAGAVNLLFLPGISRWSDEYRSRWGRRIPFLAVVTPITVVSVILVGFAPEIGAWVHSRVTIHIAPAVSLTAVILTLLCGLVVAFHYFNMVLCNGFTWLVRDVVPYEVMARFLSWFRIIGTVSSVAFSWYVFPYIISHRKEICVGVGLETMVRIENETRTLPGDSSLSRRRELIHEVDKAGLLATPANSYINELVVEAARMSILADGDLVNIVYGD